MKNKGISSYAIFEIYPSTQSFYLMENQNTFEQQLALLRLNDIAKTLTNYPGQSTPPPIFMDVLMNLLETLQNVPETKHMKFHLRTLYFRYLNTMTHHPTDPTNLLKIALSCFYFTLDTLNTGMTTGQLDAMLAGGQFQTYYLSIEHFQILQELAQLTLDSVEVTTPYQFSDLVLSKHYKNPVDNIIDLCLTMTQASNMTAQEVFIASCMHLSQAHLHSPLSLFLQNKFSGALVGGAQLKAKLQELIVEVDHQVE